MNLAESGDLMRAQCDGVPLASWVSELLLSGKVKPLGEAEAKASVNSAYSHWGQTRSQVIYPWPG